MASAGNKATCLLAVNHTTKNNASIHQWTEFQCHTFFPSQDIKQNVLLSSYLDSW